jgi:hypothetical protein
MATFDLSTAKPVDNSGDYDYAAAIAAGVGPDPVTGHWPDTYKRPTEITFSDESKFSTAHTPGGKWRQDRRGVWSYEPSSFVLHEHSPEELREHFRRDEDQQSRLILPGEPEGLPSERGPISLDAPAPPAQQPKPVFDLATAKPYIPPGGIPDSETGNLQDTKAPEDTSTLRDRAEGALEALLATGSGVAGGAIGGVAGLLRSLAHPGQLGTQAGVQASGNTAEQVAQSWSYPPKTAKGREYTQAIADFIQDSGFSSLMPDMVPNLRVQPGMAVKQARGQFNLRSPEAAAAAAQAHLEKAAPDVRVNWNELAPKVQEHLTKLAEDPKFEQRNPDALARVARWQSLPVPLEGTKGQATRIPPQLRTEAQLGQTWAGSNLNALHQEQNAIIHQNLNALRERMRVPKPQSDSDIGAAVVAALKGNDARSEAHVNALYAAARADGEGISVPINTLVDHINDHVNDAKIAYVTNYLQKRGAIKRRKGKWVAKREMTLNELDQVWKTATTEGQASKTDKHYANEIKKVINEIQEGRGGDQYQAARRARFQRGQQYEDRDSIAKLIEDKRNSPDPRTAREDVFKEVIFNTSAAELKNIKRELFMTPEGRRAWSSLQGGTIEWIRDKAQGAADEKGVRNIAGGAFDTALSKINDEKIDILFNSGTARDLRALKTSTEDVKTFPPGRQPGSDTMANALGWLGKWAGVPGVKQAINWQKARSALKTPYDK